ncbi:P-loop containing nucleoside triphosphate hydrolase protein [Chaetomium sp. MPI-SDFR-AT-0129]|nr:P-loop containing nucleoside triphosphate hydrolase protein [Chaetomium sp. MPI-SDFR-AT-0129]
MDSPNTPVSQLSKRRREAVGPDACTSLTKRPRQGGNADGDARLPYAALPPFAHCPELPFEWPYSGNSFTSPQGFIVEIREFTDNSIQPQLYRRDILASIPQNNGAYIFPPDEQGHQRSLHISDAGTWNIFLQTLRDRGVPLSPGERDLPPYRLHFWALPPGQSATDAFLSRQQAVAPAPPQRTLPPAPSPGSSLQPSPSAPSHKGIDRASDSLADNSRTGHSDSDSDDEALVFVSERPAAQAGDQTGSQSEAGNSDDIAGSENNVLESLASSLYTVDDAERWAATCQFFCHDVARTAHDEGAQLQGTKFPLHPYQMEAVYEQLKRSFGEGLGGGIIALDTGLGKTVTTLAVVAVMRLAELNAAEVRRDPRITGRVPYRPHNKSETTTACPSQNPWGIECYCVSGSLTNCIARGLAPGPSLVLTPANVVEQFARQAKAYLAMVVQIPESECYMAFVDTIGTSTDRASLASEVRADILMDFVGEHPEFSAPKTGKPPALVPGFGSEMGYTEAQKSQLFDRHRLIIVSSNPHSLVAKGKGCDFFARVYQLQQHKRVTRVEHIVEWAIAPRFVVLDEFHTTKDSSTKVYQALKQMRTRAPAGQGFKLAALSATPITVSLYKSLESVLSFILPQPADLTTFLAAAQAIDSATRAGGAKDRDKLNDATARCEQMLKAIMTRRMGNSLFHGKALLRLPEMHAVTVPCRSERVQGDDFRRRIAKLREVWDSEARARLAGQSTGGNGGSISDKFFQVVRYNSAFMQMLWLASFPGLVDLPSHLSSNLGGWLNSDKLGSSIGTREGRSAHEVGQHIDTISKGSGKLEALERCLEQARTDRAVGSVGRDGQAPPCLKKHVCVFAARPGTALIIAAYADKHWADEWDVVLVLSAATKKGKQAIQDAFLKIPFDGAGKPTLLISTTGTTGTGLDSLQRANHAVLFELPFVETEAQQAGGRIHRAGQQLPCHWTKLWAADSEAETLIKERHEKRFEAFSRILRDGESDRARVGGDASQLGSPSRLYI